MWEVDSEGHSGSILRVILEVNTEVILEVNTEVNPEVNTGTSSNTDLLGN